MADLKAWKIQKGRKPLVFRGARQVGKTWLLKQFGKQEFPNFHYINFEEDDRLDRLFQGDLRPGRLLDELRFYLDHAIDPTRDLIILDEIQRSPRALSSLKYFHEQMPGLALCAAGSLIGVFMSSESFPVGQVDFLDLRPMSFEEFLQGLGEDSLYELITRHNFSRPLPASAHDRLWELWKQYLVVGGLPEAVQIFSDQKSNLYDAFKAIRALQKTMLDAYLADMAKHSGRMNALNLERLWRNVPVQLAQAQDGSATKFRFREAVSGIRGYEQLLGPLSWLEKADLLIRSSIVENAALPLAGYARENRFKLYLFDVGLLGALAGLAPVVFLQYGFGNYQGYVAENFVAQELRAAGLDRLFCWQGRTSEIEFLLAAGTEIIPWEVKSGRVTHSKSLTVYEQRHAPKTAVVLSARNNPGKGPRLQAPLYAAGTLARRMIEGSWRKE
jgi:predicted AAA+ superfamily ATPase